MIRKLTQVLLVVMLLATIVPVGGAVAQTNNTTNVSDVAPYYEGNTSEVNNESWMSGRENATLDNIVHYATRIGPFVIGGTGAEAQGGGYVGPAMVSLFIMGFILSMLLSSRAGVVGSVTIAIASAGGLANAGVAPGWIFAVVLFVVGMILARVIRSQL